MKGSTVLGVFFGYLILLGVMSGIGYWLFQEFHEVKIVEVPVRREIERAIEVKGLENKFVVLSSGFFRAAGAGGIGAPQVHTKDAEQFVELVPPEERIYVSFELGEDAWGDPDNEVLKKIYWAFIENRAGLVSYEDVYTKGNEYQVVSWDTTKVVFKFDNWGDVLGGIASILSFFAFMGLVGVFCCFLFYLDDKERKKMKMSKW